MAGPWTLAEQPEAPCGALARLPLFREGATAGQANHLGFLCFTGVSVAQYPMFPMWVQDYLADTSHLNATEHGVYHLLLYRYWLTDCRPLPDDLHFLLRVTKCRSKRVVNTVLAEFWELSTGEGWRHKRVESEFRAAQERSSVARKSAKKRWKINDHVYADAMRTQCSPTHLHKKEKDTTNVVSKKKAAKAFRKPTAQEVQAYLDERGITEFSGKFFVDSNEAKGWLVGSTKTPMKDWRAVVRTWEANRKQRRVQSSGQNWRTQIEQEAKAKNVTARPGEEYEQFAARVRQTR